MKYGENAYIFLVESEELTSYSKQKAEELAAWVENIRKIIGFDGAIATRDDGRDMYFIGTPEKPNEFSKKNFKTGRWMPDRRYAEGKAALKAIAKLGTFTRGVDALLKDKEWYVEGWMDYKGKTYIPSTRMLTDKEHKQFIVAVPKIKPGHDFYAGNLDDVLAKLRACATEITYGDYYDNYREKMRLSVI